MKFGRLIICWIPRTWRSYRLGVSLKGNFVNVHLVVGIVRFVWATDSYLRYMREFDLRGGA